MASSPPLSSTDRLLLAVYRVQILSFSAASKFTTFPNNRMSRSLKMASRKMASKSGVDFCTLSTEECASESGRCTVQSSTEKSMNRQPWRFMTWLTGNNLETILPLWLMHTGFAIARTSLYLQSGRLSRTFRYMLPIVPVHCLQQLFTVGMGARIVL